MAFVFRLEKVARVRRRVVDQCSREVADSGRVVGELDARIAALAADIVHHRNEPLGPGTHGCGVQAMLTRTMWLEHLEELRRNRARELDVARSALEAARERLQGAWRDLEVLDRLRSRQEAAWREAEQRRERREMDEVGQVRATRRSRSKVAT